MKRKYFLVALLLVSTLVFLSCDNKALLIDTDLARISDGVAVNCEPFPDKASRCLVFTQPWNEQIRIYDLGVNALIPSPTGIFPLAVKVGKYTTIVRSHPQLNFSYALDSVEGKLFVTSNVHSSSAQSFSAPMVINTAQGASDFVFVESDNFPPVAVLAIPGRQMLSRIVIDPVSGLQDSTLSMPDVLLSFMPQQLALSADHKSVVISNAQGSFIGILKAGAQKATLIDIGGPSIKIAAGNMDLGAGPENFAIILRIDKAEAVVVSLDHEKVIKRFQLSQAPTQIYIPNPSTANFKDSSAWAIVISAYSQLSYLSLRNLYTVSDDELNSPSYVSSTDLADVKSLGARASLASAIIPGLDNGGARECYIIFETGVIAKFIEGQSEVKKISAD